MKKSHRLGAACAVLLILGITTSVNASLYNGNGNTGYGGAIGQSTLEITDNGTTLQFDLTKGTGNLNDVFVIYMDTVAGGFASNVGMNDQADNSRKAIAGCVSTTCTDITFGFDADYAIAFDATNGGFLFGLATGSSLGFLESAGGAGAVSDSAFTFSVSMANLGLTPFSGDTVNYVGTYVSNFLTGVDLSNEGYGAGLPGTNPLSPASETFTSSLAYTTSTVPIPATVWLFGSGLLGLVGMARRKKIA